LVGGDKDEVVAIGAQQGCPVQCGTQHKRIGGVDGMLNDQIRGLCLGAGATKQEGGVSVPALWGYPASK